MKKLIITYSIIIYLIIIINFKKEFISDHFVSILLIIQLILFSVTIFFNIKKKYEKKLF